MGRSLSLENFLTNYPADFESKKGFDFICADLSFISLTRVLGVLSSLLDARGKIVLLVKPQFEVGLEAVRRVRGVLRDDAEIISCVENVLTQTRAILKDFSFIGITESPIRGGDGNREFLILFGG